MPHRQPAGQSAFEEEVSGERATRDVSIIRRHVRWNGFVFQTLAKILSRKEVCDGSHNYLKTIRQRG